MNTLRTISRVLTGLIFLFSGFVKAVDPMGSTYKFIDYFDAFMTPWMAPFALPLAILLSSFEFTIGAALILKLRMRLAAIVLLLFMGFFTILTFFLALYNPVADCGCFGDAIIMTNWETFYKNVITMFFTLLVFFGRKKYRQILADGVQNISLIIVFIIITGVSIHAWMHLPMIDFLPYKKGVSLRVKPSRVDAFLIYKNNETGEVKEWISEELPWEDSLWVATWDYVDRRVVEYKEPGVVELPLMDEFGYDVSTSVFAEDGYLLLVSIPKIKETREKAIPKLKELYDRASDDGVQMIAASGDVMDEIIAFRENYEILFPVYQADDITLKMVVRANPGLVLLHDGVVVKKWHNNDFPDYDKLKKMFLKQL